VADFNFWQRVFIECAEWVFSLKKSLKNISMSVSLYGPLHRIYRQLLDREGLRRFRDGVALYAPFISPGDLCFDVGSNIGEKTEAFLKLGARVVAFEPQPYCARETSARCGPNRRLTTVDAAIGAVPGTQPMYVGSNTQVSSLISNWAQDARRVIQVRVMTLDQAIDQYGLPQFCKIDVEGYEMEVLRGLTHAIPFLTIEYQLNEKGIRKTIDCVDHLSRFGELSINITLGEEAGFHWPQWIDYNSFQEYFPTLAPRSPTCGYGDLFIRLRP
jgi:FkbM family methyltransferase